MPILLLISLDLFWSVAAMIYDASKLRTLSPLLWPFVAVCPIFPLLLALVLLQLYRKKTPNQFLLAFAAIPSTIYGILAILYYPVAMIYQGFSWNAFGQIFWVAFYSLQGIWLLKRYPIKNTPFVLVLAFLVIKLIVIDLYYKSFGYFDFTNIPFAVEILIFILSFLFFSILLEVLIKKR